MKQIASFSVDHDKLEKGMYVSRIDGDVITYDIRMKKPNSVHTFEHLFATYARNSSFAGSVIYIGPMGCRTGFYLLLRDTVGRADAIALVKDAFGFIRDFKGEIPGSRRQECGNFQEHDLSGARETAADMLAVLHEWTEKKLEYKG